MAKSIDLSKMNVADIDKKFEKLSPTAARRIDNGGTKAKPKRTIKKKK